MSPAATFHNVLENFSAEILNNLNLMKSKLNECLTQKFISMKFKELLVEKQRAASM
jgi:hypothetical protein